MDAIAQEAEKATIDEAELRATDFENENLRSLLKTVEISKNRTAKAD